MSDTAIIVSGAFGFLGTCVVSYRMIVGWNYKFKTKALELEHEMKLRQIEAKKEADKQAVADIKVLQSQFEKTCEQFKLEMKMVMTEFKKVQESNKGAMSTMAAYMEQAEKRLKSMEVKVDEVMQKFGNVTVKKGSI